ncbi:protein-L-isoaspartate O-methyltransferase [Methylobacter sp. S3L5C]|uniref:protein-L-isoaspartate O-methyltransferase family protein n=1 Tax=Methylobacter sp. S3L5C TaxID=2839024 RepID=UPI001FAB3FF7|nr:protein-L-isoaspartate O-methyltransferase [Methylobacter sp. S3L5C]
MSDLLNTKSSYVILEIGTGSGYQTAILSQLVQQVYSMEIIEDLVTTSGRRLNKLGYNNIDIRQGDGYFGWAEHAPYDGIIVTAAASHIPQPLIDQLGEGARLIIPVGLPYRYQELMVVEKKPRVKLKPERFLVSDLCHLPAGISLDIVLDRYLKLSCAYF